MATALLAGETGGENDVGGSSGVRDLVAKDLADTVGKVVDERCPESGLECTEISPRDIINFPT